MKPACPVLGFAAFSGTGKTTLLTKLIPLLRKQGKRVAVIKHSHHDVELDTPGKDSYELRHAGAQQTLLASPKRWSLITETPCSSETGLTDMLSQLDSTQLDIILVEGYRDANIAKIELHRSTLNRPFLFSNDHNIIAIASDIAINVDTELPVLDLNNPVTVADFILNWMKEK